VKSNVIALKDEVVRSSIAGSVEDPGGIETAEIILLARLIPAY